MDVSTIYIDKEFVIGHLEDVDLSGLPVIHHERRVIRPVLIGYINHHRALDNYAFGLTNNYGVDAGAIPSAPVQLYIDKKEWVDKEPIKEDRWIVFELLKQKGRTRHRALRARYLRPTVEDYSIAKNYNGEYSRIQGQILGNYFSTNVDINVNKEICELFLSSSEGKQIILDELYRRKVVAPGEWVSYLSHLSNEEKEEFVLDETQIKPTAELRVALCSQLGKVDWLLHPSVIWYLNSNVDTDGYSVEDILKQIKTEDDRQKFMDYVANSTTSSDKLKEKLFLSSFSLSIYNSLSSKENLIKQCEEQGAKKVTQFFLFHIHNLPDADTAILPNLLPKDVFVSALKLLNTTEAYQLLIRLNEQFALDIVTSDFRNTELSTLYIGDKWDSLKSEIPYVAFDLESDGTTVNQFAFLAEDNIRTYSGEEQLNSLIRKLKKQEIIVGHNIKQWDLPILEKKGLKTNAFVWDTLEMEILLNPCRYAYSLRTSHNAADDTKLVNDLFWNQLFRLSEDNELVGQLQPVLPTQIIDILKHLQVEYFADYFKSTAKTNQQFFQELRPISENITKQLNEINAIPADEPTLIVAPENLWARIAQMIHVEFPVVGDKQKYSCVSKEKLLEHPLDSIIEQKILERFCIVSKTPLWENLAQYLKTEDGKSGKIVFAKDKLSDYLDYSKSHIDCIDINAFENKSITDKRYKHIYVIGAELHDRVHKCKIIEDKSFADLIASGSKLPFVMANTNFAPVKKEEFGLLGITIPKLAANIWVERQQSGLFAFYLNYQYQAYRKHFFDHFETKPQIINWEIDGEDRDRINLIQVSRERYASDIVRVNASTTERSKYWLFQLEIVRMIHSENPSLPLVYVVNDLTEVEGLTAYATSLGYYIPNQGTGFRKLEYIGKHPHGMIIISKKQFEDGIGSYRTDHPFCYVGQTSF